MKTKRLSILFMLLLMVGAGTFNSCSFQQHTTNNQNKIEWLNIKCFQTLGNTSEYSSCLAMNDNFDIFYVVSYAYPGKNKTDIYYDGKSLSGRYVFVGTYTYESKENRTRTVQAYMPKKNFDELYAYNKEFLKGLLNVVLSYNVIQ